MTAPILIMAGGTGGHVFPALAVARALQGCDQQVVWLGSRHGIENELVPREGFPLEATRVSGLRGKGIWSWCLAPLKLLLAIYDALRVVIRLRPKLVLGMGGFASGPGGLAAWMLGKPLIIHEQNSVAGLTNRLLAGFAREVLEAFPGSFSAGITVRLVGNPVRQAIAALPEPSVRLAGRAGPIRVLVLGGSQGARVLNELVPLAVSLLGADQQCEVWHQSGRTDFTQTRATYKSAGLDVRVEAFIDNVAECYGWADLVICRAGALTISELTAAGLGAILVPYPSAVDDHQTKNARYLVAASAAVLIPQSELTAELLATELRRCCEDRTLLIDRAVSARKLARPDATSDVVDLCLAMVQAS
ncbi:MAG: undecaprenyldiphospho-muramoylpentapeptide beta-N-acetylglucosaminyltransferase [Gammaproteobacteria bacterium]|jgi:UDP-N-acetylglucosamine--N-acetylmuramyl-(pentapeptide) pyrophosphoryl-undecaprenol N-acetylglucosamine transferase|nr:undecaprenyldiphospho-muramoylpentapeptide beta-N-acetylglucosaminyltransferase [Chromatiales bacterium]MDP6673400.1 undecaprenyldiphospho-muramoylpentapeptide beta-N-acetylglucosaminyltransferase [Gammaproteobacteria bacterium]